MTQQSEIGGHHPSLWQRFAIGKMIEIIKVNIVCVQKTFPEKVCPLTLIRVIIWHNPDKLGNTESLYAYRLSICLSRAKK